MRCLDQINVKFIKSNEKAYSRMYRELKRKKKIRIPIGIKITESENCAHIVL